MKSKGSKLKKIIIKSGIDVKETKNKEREKKDFQNTGSRVQAGTHILENNSQHTVAIKRVHII